VLVLMNGSALAVNWARGHVPAIVEAWYPGQGGGTAVADVLFGDYNPSGRLPVTFYRSVDQLPAFTDYAMTRGMKGRTYRYFDGDPLYPFGFGLSYTTFAYRKLSLPGRVKAGDEVQVAVEVENTGSRSGEEVVQLYMSAAGATGPQPKHWLAAFERVALRAGEKKTVRFALSARRFSLTQISTTHISTTQANGHRVVEPGTFEVSVGGGQTGAVTGRVAVEGPAKDLN
jgi:beta-glucosidase